MAEVRYWEDPATERRYLTVTIERRDLYDLKLDEFDKMVLRDCYGPGRSGSDWLLGAELLVRRIEEAAERRKRASALAEQEAK